MLEKGNYIVVFFKDYGFRIILSCFVFVEEKNYVLKLKEIELGEEVLSVKGINNVRNGIIDISVYENGVVFQYGKIVLLEKIIFGKDMLDFFEGLEIIVDEFSDEEGDLGLVVYEDEKENDSFVDVVEINGIIDSLIEYGKQNVKILYSVELEEECFVIRIDNSVERQEFDVLSFKIGYVFEVEEIKSYISMNDQFV